MRKSAFHALPILLLAAACGTDSAGSANSANQNANASAPWFKEVAAERGLDFVHLRGLPKRFWFPEIAAGGGGFLDYNGDGHLDIYLVQSAVLVPDEVPAELADQPFPGNRLYRGKGDGSFADVTEEAGVGDAGYGMGFAVGDTDGDGDQDLFVSNVGRNVLYRNNGDGSFTDVSAASDLEHEGWTTSCAFLDYDRDGDLDLFAANYVNWSPGVEIPCRSHYGDRDYCHPNNYNSPTSDLLYENDGNGHFTDVSRRAGLTENFGNGLGVAVADFDANGYPDVYVANDLLANQLWMNQGDGTFKDEALLAGCAVNMNGTAEAGMGVAAVDIENDGDMDLFMTHLRDETNTCYVNRGGFFSDKTSLTGLGGPSIRFTGWGMGFADFNHDGERDTYVANGRVGIWMPEYDTVDRYAEPNLLFRGLPGGGFEEVLPRGGVAVPLVHNTRATAYGDMDGDGDIDVLVVDNDGPVRLLENTAPDQGHFLQLRVLDAHGFDAVGARVELPGPAAGQRPTQWRGVQVAYSYCASHDPRVHFGLGSASQAASVTVHWIEGQAEVFGPLEVDRSHTLRQGAGQALKR
ncbi:MAG: CRTAC1 family protein [Planctomycetota bacterium]|jgi:hypothetical protein|nr:CRTAC1 family protein [Planctomycetota bacterium]MDP6838911.1 CRTAC1 family protein [Planctomycetota bacterium]